MSLSLCLWPSVLGAAICSIFSMLLGIFGLETASQDSDERPALYDDPDLCVASRFMTPSMDCFVKKVTNGILLTL